MLEDKGSASDKKRITSNRFIILLERQNKEDNYFLCKVLSLVSLCTYLFIGLILSIGNTKIKLLLIFRLINENFLSTC